jgi:acyl-CoA hydrolase
MTTDLKHGRATDTGRDHFHWFSWHYTGYERAKGDSGLATYIPCNLGEIPDYYRRFVEPPEIAVIKTCPKDERGLFNFSLAALWHRAIVERAQLVIVEESAGLPYIDGLENAVHESEVDYIIRVTTGPPRRCQTRRPPTSITPSRC